MKRITADFQKKADNISAPWEVKVDRVLSHKELILERKRASRSEAKRIKLMQGALPLF